MRRRDGLRGTALVKWERSFRFDPLVRPMADRHYNRQTPGSPQFSPPGRLLVLRLPRGGAYWTTSWPFAEYTKHEWGGAWINSAFRNESREFLSSDLILDAVAATRAWFGETPALGMVTFIDADKVRRKRDPGRCYRRAGFHHPTLPAGCAATTKGGLVVLQLLPHEMPEASMPLDYAPLFAGGSA